MNQHELTLGALIKNARKKQGFSQRKLAEKIGMDFTYISKLENNRVLYPPSETAIRAIAQTLDLNEEELIFLAGRIPECNFPLLKQNYQEMAVLFRRMRDIPGFTEKVFDLCS